MADYKKRWQPNKGSGAKEGLEKKLSYWENKDFQYEFGVTLGMCMNLTVQMGYDTEDEDKFLKKVFEIFKVATRIKSSKPFIEHFSEYYTKKMDIKDILKQSE